MLTRNDITRRLAQGLEFNPFSVTVRENAAVRDLREGRSQADYIFSIGWQNESREFVVESKSVPGLANLQGAIARAKAVAYSNPGYFPMVLMPYLRREALDELVKAETSGLDLCGNGVIYVPGEWFAYRTGAQNQFPDSSPVVSPFRGNQSIVARAFLTRRAFGNQKEIVSYLGDSGIAPSTVSKMLTALEQELLITKKPDIRLVRAEALLDRLRDDYPALVSRREEKIRLIESESAWVRINKNVAESGVRYAISNPERYTVLPRNTSGLRVFTNNIDALLTGIDYVSDDRFPTLDVIETESRVPLFDKRFTIDRWWTSPIQEYLELANGSKREADAAVAIRKTILQSAPLNDT